MPCISPQCGFRLRSRVPPQRLHDEQDRTRGGAFKLTEAHLHSLFQAANFDISNEMNFVGLRGCVPVEQGGTGFAGQHDLEYVGVDYMHLRCTFVQWMPGAGFAVFPGSSVPHQKAIQSHIGQATKKLGA